MAEVFEKAARDLSGGQESAARPSRAPLRPLCASSRFAKSCPQKCSGSYPAAHAFAFLRYDFAARFESNGCSRAHFPLLKSWVPSRVWLAELGICLWELGRYPQDPKINLVLRDDARKGTPPRDVSPAGKRAREQPMASSRNEKSMHRKTKCSGLGKTRPDSEQSIYRSELKLKGAAGRAGEGHAVLSWPPDTSLVTRTKKILSSQLYRSLL